MDILTAKSLDVEKTVLILFYFFAATIEDIECECIEAMGNLSNLVQKPSL